MKRVIRAVLKTEHSIEINGPGENLLSFNQ